MNSCCKDLTITIETASTDPTRSLIYAPVTGDFYCHYYSLAKWYRVDGTTLAKGSSISTPNGNYFSAIYNSSNSKIYGASTDNHHSRYSPTTLAVEADMGNAYDSKDVFLCDANGYIYFAKESAVSCIDPATDTLINQIICNIAWGMAIINRRAVSGDYCPTTGEVWWGFANAGHPSMEPDIVTSTTGLVYSGYYFIPNNLGGSSDGWIVGGVRYCPNVDRMAVGNLNVIYFFDPTQVGGTYVIDFQSADLGSPVYDMLYDSTDGHLYAHLKNGNVVEYDPVTNSVVTTYTGFQALNAFEEGGLSRMAFTAGNAHLYVSSYGPKKVF